MGPILPAAKLFQSRFQITYLSANTQVCISILFIDTPSFPLFITTCYMPIFTWFCVYSNIHLSIPIPLPHCFTYHSFTVFCYLVTLALSNNMNYKNCYLILITTFRSRLLSPFCRWENEELEQLSIVLRSPWADKWWS